MIPLSALIRVHELWERAGAESPIRQQLYEYVLAHGDEVERGRTNVPPEKVASLRDTCWEMLTRLSVQGDMFRTARWSNTTVPSADDIRDIVIDAGEFSIAALRRLGLQPTRGTVLEYVNEIDDRWRKHYPHPGHISLAMRILNDQPTVIDSLL